MKNIHNVDMNSSALRIHIFADTVANSFPFLDVGQETTPPRCQHGWGEDQRSTTHKSRCSNAAWPLCRHGRLHTLHQQLAISYLLRAFRPTPATSRMVNGPCSRRQGRISVASLSGSPSLRQTSAAERSFDATCGASRGCFFLRRHARFVSFLSFFVLTPAARA